MVTVLNNVQSQEADATFHHSKHDEQHDRHRSVRPGRKPRKERDRSPDKELQFKTACKAILDFRAFSVSYMLTQSVHEWLKLLLI